MKNDRQIEKIINQYIPLIDAGQESLESVVEKFPQFTLDLRPRLEAALWLRQRRFELSTRPGFIHDSRSYLEAKIEQVQPKGFFGKILRHHTPQRWVFNIAAPIVVTLFLALVINSTILTARLSIPGEPLYSTKLIIEDVQLLFTYDPVKRTDLNIEFSRQRALEFVELVMEGDYERLPQAAERMEIDIIASLRSLNEVDGGQASIDQATLASFQDILASEVMMLDVLRGTTPPSAYEGITMGINVAQTGLLALR